MNSVVIARDFAYPLSRQTHPRQRRAAARARAAVLPWAEVPVASSVYRSNNQGSAKPALYGWALVILVVLVHLSLTWYASHRIATPVAPHTTELAVQLVRPTPPEAKRIEPPKPLKATPKVQRQVRTVPRINQTAAEPREDAAETPSVAAPASVPVAQTTAAPPAAESAPFGKAGYLNNPPPGYPPLAARNHWEGKVVLRVRVLSSGLVDSVAVQKSSGRTVLDEEAERAVKHWVFAPAKRGDSPIDGWASVPIEFLL